MKGGGSRRDSAEVRRSTDPGGEARERRGSGDVRAGAGEGRGVRRGTGGPTAEAGGGGKGRGGAEAGKVAVDLPEAAMGGGSGGGSKASDVPDAGPAAQITSVLKGAPSLCHCGALSPSFAWPHRRRHKVCGAPIPHTSRDGDQAHRLRDTGMRIKGADSACPSGRDRERTVPPEQHPQQQP